MQRMTIYPRPWKVLARRPFSRSFSQHPSSFNHELFFWQPGHQCHRRYKVRGHMRRRSHASATGGIEKGKDFGNRLHGVLKSIWLTFAVASRSVGDKAYNAEAGTSITVLRFILLDLWSPLDLGAMCNNAFCIRFSAEGTKSNRSLLYGFLWMCCYCVGFCGRRWKILIFYMYSCGRRWRRHSFACVFVEDAGINKRIYPILYSYFFQRLPQNHYGFSVFFSVFHKNT